MLGLCFARCAVLYRRSGTPNRTVPVRCTAFLLPPAALLCFCFALPCLTVHYRCRALPSEAQPHPAIAEPCVALNCCCSAYATWLFRCLSAPCCSMRRATVAFSAVHLSALHTCAVAPQLSASRCLCVAQRVLAQPCRCSAVSFDATPLLRVTLPRQCLDPLCVAIPSLRPRTASPCFAIPMLRFTVPRRCSTWRCLSDAYLCCAAAGALPCQGAALRYSATYCHRFAIPSQLRATPSLTCAKQTLLCLCRACRSITSPGLC